MAFVGFWMIPLALIFSWLTPIISFFGGVMGVGQAEIVLPHDPENGIVWEYKSEDEAFIKLADDEIKNGQHIFTFMGRDMFDEKRSVDTSDQTVSDVVFEDADGNEKRYFVFVETSTLKNVYFGDLEIFEDTECVSFQYTVKARTEVEGAFWSVEDVDNDSDSQNRFVGVRKPENVHEHTYDFVFGPEDIKDQTFIIEFRYNDSRSAPVALEKIEVIFEMTDKKVKVVEEKFYVRDAYYDYVEVKK